MAPTKLAERSTDTLDVFDAKTGRFTLPKLPFEDDALLPVTSAETVKEHHGKHHKGYVDNANKALAGYDQSFASAFEVIAFARGSDDETLYEQAAQALNHAFFWQCLGPSPKPADRSELADAINEAFGSFDNMVTEAVGFAKSRVGSGWLWLVADADGALALTLTDDAETELDQQDLTVILVCDIWEHAYYLDHKSAKPDWVKGFFGQLVDWPKAAERYSSATR